MRKIVAGFFSSFLFVFCIGSFAHAQRGVTYFDNFGLQQGTVKDNGRGYDVFDNFGIKKGEIRRQGPLPVVTMPPPPLLSSSPNPAPDLSPIFNSLSQSQSLSLQKARLRLEIKKNLEIKIKQLAEQLKTLRRSEPISDDVINQPKKNRD